MPSCPCPVCSAPPPRQQDRNGTDFEVRPTRVHSQPGCVPPADAGQVLAALSLNFLLCGVGVMTPLQHLTEGLLYTQPDLQDSWVPAGGTTGSTRCSPVGVLLKGDHTANAGLGAVLFGPLDTAQVQGNEAGMRAAPA